MIICESEYPKILDEILEFLGSDDIELVFVGADEMREINLQNRGIDKATDVLSFPYVKMQNFPIGSVVINTDEVGLKAKEFNHSQNDEIALLFTHGMLHILGFDHENDNGEMRDKESEIIAKFALPKSLIVRVQEKG